MSKGRRYDREPKKLNVKKIFGIIIAIAVTAMVVLVIKNILSTKKTPNTKITSKSYYTCFENEKWGVISDKGETIISPSYQEMIIIPNNKKDVFLIVYDTNYETGTYNTKVLNNSNTEIFTDYEKVEAISNNDKSNNLWYESNVLKICQNGKYGLIDLDGAILLEPQYDEITAVSGIENALKVKKDGKYGIYDNKGTQILPITYMDITNLGDDNKAGYIVKAEDGKYGIVDYSNKVVLESVYDSIDKVSGCNLYVVTEGGTKKVVDKDGKNVVASGFDNIISISQISSDDASIIFETGSKYGIMKLDGTIKIEPTYQKLSEAGQGIYIAKQNDKYGIIDSTNTPKIPFEYSNITYNKKSEIYVLEDTSFNNILLNNNLEEKLKGILLEINEEKDYIKMRENGEYKYYNFKFEEKPSSTFLTSSTLFLSKKDGKYGFIDENGKVIVDYQYEDATEQNTCGYAAIKKDGKWGSINSIGEVSQEPTYNLDNYLEIDFIGRWHKGIDSNLNYYCKD